MLYAEALGNTFNQPAAWETREICEIMNTGIANGAITGWKAYKNPKRYGKYGSQKGWERIKEPTPVDIKVDKVITPDDDLPFE